MPFMYNLLIYTFPGHRFIYFRHMNKINYFKTYGMEIIFNKNILHNRSCGVITINKFSNI